MNYLEEYVLALDLVILPEQKTIIVNPDSKFAYLSPAIRKEYGLVEEGFKQDSYADLLPIKQIASLCTSEDVECLKTLKIQRYITSQNHYGEIQLYLKQKTPIIDLKTRLGVGVRIDFSPIYSLGSFKPYINDYITNQVNTTYWDTNSKRKKIKLTEIEELILFLLILYSKPKLITTHLNHILNKDVAVSTIRNIIHQQLLHKFKVYTMEELIDKAFILGYDTILPRILAEQFSIRI